MYIQKVTPELAESLGLADSRGALVAKVLDNGPAKAAGVKRGDVIVAFDNQPVDDSRELPLLVGRTDLGHKGTLKVIRDKQTLDLPVTITQSREPEILASAEKSAKPGKQYMALSDETLRPNATRQQDHSHARLLIPVRSSRDSVA